MKKHIFKATRMGWGKEVDCCYFDADYYTREEAEAQFKPVQKWAEKNNGMVPYTAYEYDGVEYYKVEYYGLHDADHMPK